MLDFIKRLTTKTDYEPNRNHQKLIGNHSWIACLHIHTFVYTSQAVWQFVHKLWHTLQSGPGPGPGPSEKANPGSLEKVDPIPNFSVVVKDSFLTNLRELISNMTIVY